MENNVGSFGVIKAKLQQFKRKHYTNRVIRGVIVMALMSSSMFLFFALAEGSLWMSPTWKTALFYFFALSSITVFLTMIAYPLLKIANIGKTMTDHEAAKLIGKHFAEVDDRLTNLLQLNQAGNNDNSLLLAAINERIEHMRPIPFTNAISFKPNWRLARYLAIPILIAGGVFMVNADLLKGGSERFLAYNKKFNPPPPFDIEVGNHKKTVIEGDSYEIQINVSGKELPSELYMFIKDKNDKDFSKQMLTKINNAKYAFTFKNVRTDFEYYIGNDLHGSKVLDVEVLRRPSLSDFFVVIVPPAYTGMPAETLATNVGDFQALHGSTARWHFRFKGPVNEALFLSSPGIMRMNTEESNDGATAVFAKTITGNESYSVQLRSEFGVVNADTVRYNIQATPDKYPSVAIESPKAESSLPTTGLVPIVADLSDDFGFTRAMLRFKFLKSAKVGKVSDKYTDIPLAVQGGKNVQTIEQVIDFIKANVEEGDEIEYFVQVWDNDLISGPKTATSTAQKLNYKSITDQYAEADSAGQSFKDNMQSTITDADELTKQFNDIQKDLLDRKDISYEDRKRIQDQIKKAQDILKKTEDAREKLQEQLDIAKDNSLFTDETMRKIQQLEDLLEKINTPEMEKFLKDLKDKLDEMNKNQLKEELNEFEQNAETMKQDLERALELFKQLQIDQKTQEIMQKLDNLQQKQEMLKDKLDDAKTPQEQKDIQDKQKELNEEMKKIDKDLEELKNLKENTQNKDQDKEEMQELDQMSDQTQQDMKQADEELGKKDSKKAQKSQKQAAQKMQQMKEKLEKMQKENEQEQQAENYEDLRNLLENLIKLSFEQEELRDQIAKSRFNDPAVRKMVIQQGKIKDDMKMIEDSLIALSKRAFEIEKVVTDELKDINTSMRRALEYLAEKQNSSANAEQHRIMTGLNNLANMLTESLNQMQQNMKMMAGMGKGCKMPKSGKGNQNMKQMAQEQGELNKGLQKLMQQMQNGKMDPKSLQEMAARQEALRKKIKEMFDKMKQAGESGMGDLDQMQKDMQKSEEELRKQLLNAELLERNERIKSRMLDFDKAMREREYDKKRKSVTGKELKVTSPADLEPNQIQDRIRKENYNKDKFRYTPMYQNLIEQYYKLLEGGKK
jgi:hypothetical protein